MTETALNDQAIDFLTQECDRLLSLYTQAHDSVQSVFNFYLTFVSAVIGGVVLIVQSGADFVGQRLTVSALLFFAAIVGSVYLSALSGRYAHAARYANGVDEIRRFLIQRLNVPVPSVYDSLLEARSGNKANTLQKTWSGFLWLFPSGTYQMFVAIVNSAALSGMVIALASGVGADFNTTVFAAFVIFVVVLSIYNFYSRLVIQRLSSRKINIDLHYDLPAWAARD